MAITTAREQWELVAPFVSDRWVTMQELAELSGLSRTRVTHALMHARSHGFVEEETRVCLYRDNQKYRKSVYKKRVAFPLST